MKKQSNKNIKIRNKTEMFSRDLLELTNDSKLESLIQKSVFEIKTQDPNCNINKFIYF